jgi:hypothetical protein
MAGPPRCLAIRELPQGQPSLTFALGCCTLMKNILLILLSGFVLCGCSKKHTVSARPAIELVEAGKDVAWSDGYLLHVTSRDGDSLEGIRIVKTETNGRIVTITADKGTLKPLAGNLHRDGVIISTNALTITLKDPQFQGFRTQTVKELMVILHQ